MKDGGQKDGESERPEDRKSGSAKDEALGYMNPLMR